MKMNREGIWGKVSSELGLGKGEETGLEERYEEGVCWRWEWGPMRSG